MNIVFVCTGNTCRSPMAEGIFRNITSDFSEYVSVSSCGIGAMTGDSVSENSVIAMNDKGIDISCHRARQINQYIIDEADFIICLSDNHYNYLKTYCENKLILLGDGISDPFGGDIGVYRKCADEIEASIESLLQSDTFLHIREMIHDDTETVSEIEKNNFSDPWSQTSFISQIEKFYSVCYTAVYLGKPVGYICCDDISGEVYVGTVAVDNNMRRRGIGNKLLQQVIKYCKNNKSSILTLEVRESNIPAIKMYSSLGFENLGKRKNFYSKPIEDAYIMTKYFNGDTDENISN